jgi:hypothetical protein
MTDEIKNLETYAMDSHWTDRLLAIGFGFHSRKIPKVHPPDENVEICWYARQVKQYKMTAQPAVRVINNNPTMIHRLVGVYVVDDKDKLIYGATIPVGHAMSVIRELIAAIADNVGKHAVRVACAGIWPPHGS